MTCIKTARSLDLINTVDNCWKKRLMESLDGLREQKAQSRSGMKNSKMSEFDMFEKIYSMTEEKNSRKENPFQLLCF